LIIGHGWFTVTADLKRAGRSVSAHWSIRLRAVTGNADLEPVLERSKNLANRTDFHRLAKEEKSHE
jgi:hypothetical protein